jgi:hypothetical protein
MSEIDIETLLSEDLVDDTELAALVSSLAQHNERGQTTDIERTDLFEWAQHVRLEGLLLDMAVRGEIVVTSVEGGDPEFGLPEGE